MVTASIYGLLGGDPMAYLRERDPFERSVIDAVVQAGKDQLDIIQGNLATRIAKATWGGSKKSGTK